ncbi:hypothetical protein T05_6254 [Trichinella murrelli]|uniref:Uncharacterized protein n=1 Tax=Trichinella murrelli TaxID=144512 RepID=A0A0V0SVV9_9BILA|nr:hypothetical protein T05_6254 [Trichinella murrelli]
MIKVHIFTAHHFLSRLRYQGPAALLGSQQWELKQGFFQLDRPPRRPPPSCPLTGTSHVRSLLVPCWPETGFKEMTMSICVTYLS